MAAADAADSAAVAADVPAAAVAAVDAGLAVAVVAADGASPAGNLPAILGCGAGEQ